MSGTGVRKDSVRRPALPLVEMEIRARALEIACDKVSGTPQTLVEFATVFAKYIRDGIVAPQESGTTHPAP